MTDDIASPVLSRNAPPPRPSWPDDRRVLCIWLSDAELELLNAQVDALRRRGVAAANRSWLIQRALADFDIDVLTMPRDEDPLLDLGGEA